MTDETVAGRIEALVQEERRLRTREERDSGTLTRSRPTAAAFEQVEVELDRCWDLLRQRRALCGAGQDADGAVARDADTVEGYLQ